MKLVVNFRNYWGTKIIWLLPTIEISILTRELFINWITFELVISIE